jgi:hypothetical protein
VATVRARLKAAGMANVRQQRPPASRESTQPVEAQKASKPGLYRDLHDGIRLSNRGPRKTRPKHFAMANLSRDSMREYQRARRARIRSEAWAAVGLPPPVKSLSVALAKDAIRERVKAEAWSAANHPVPVVANSTTSHPQAPKSLYAVGGRPGPGLVSCGPGYPLPPDQFVASPYGQWQASVETMLATLAAKNDAQEKRIVALEKTVAFNEAAGRTARALTRVIGELIGARLP